METLEVQNCITTKPMENKPTAVEWLQQVMKPHLSQEQIISFEGLFQQAMDMEQRQNTEKFKKKMGISIEIDRCSIIDNGVETFLPKKLVYLADYLAKNSGKFVDRESILQNVWPGVCVLDRTIDVHVRKLRMLFPDIPIKTHKNIGYGWIPNN
jgi:two-component system alkaline phosphatase synthesis response regulator PhoP